MRIGCSLGRKVPEHWLANGAVSASAMSPYPPKADIAVLCNCVSGRHEHAPFHIRMKLAEIVGCARLFRHQLAGLLRRKGDIPVAIRRRRGVRERILVDPLDSVADLRVHIARLEHASFEDYQ